MEKVTLSILKDEGIDHIFYHEEVVYLKDSLMNLSSLGHLSELFLDQEG